MSSSSHSCTYKAESMIAIQRQILADRYLQTRSKLDLSSRAVIACEDYRYPLKYPTKDISSYKRHSIISLSKSNRPIIMPPPAARSRQPTALFNTRSAIISAKPPSVFNYERDSIGEDEHSVSTATMTTVSFEQGPPLHLPNFKPAVGCITANDFIVRCFVTRLRSGITVMKYNRSRFRKSSRLVRLMLEDNGEILVWKPAQQADEEASKDKDDKTPPRSKRLSLFSCQEVRLATTADADNQMYTGTSILREKCNNADAHKSFALIFPHRTLDITSMTEDQCKMLTEGFSALCYCLHVRQAEQLEVQEQLKRSDPQGSKGCLHF